MNMPMQEPAMWNNRAMPPLSPQYGQPRFMSHQQPHMAAEVLPQAYGYQPEVIAGVSCGVRICSQTYIGSFDQHQRFMHSSPHAPAMNMTPKRAQQTRGGDWSAQQFRGGGSAQQTRGGDWSAQQSRGGGSAQQTRGGSNAQQTRGGGGKTRGKAFQRSAASSRRFADT